MKHFTPNPGRRNVRVFLATLLSYLMLVGQVAPLALASNGSATSAAPARLSREAEGPGAGEAEGHNSSLAPAPLAPVVGPAISATKVDTFSDPDGDGKAEPGQDINYEVTVSNTGSGDATGVVFDDNIDPNTTLSGAITMSPLARNDTYAAPTGGTLNVDAASGVVANDSGLPAPSAVAATNQATTQGGTVTINTDGSFTYNPPAGAFSGPDKFTYTATNTNSPDDSATVTITFNPGAANDSATVSEDSGPTTFDVRANDPDPDGGTKTIDSVQQPANGTVTITNGGNDLTYTPNADYCNDGSSFDTFTYTLTPGGAQATVSVTVTCVNDAPVVDLDADNDKGTTGSDFAVTFTEGDAATLVEDSTDAAVTDIDSTNLSSLTVTITNLLDTGSETLSADTTGTSITANYVPATGVLTLSGPDTVANFQKVLRTVRYQNTSSNPDTTARVIHFVANDGSANSNTATSTVTVVSSDTPPTAVNDNATVNEDSGANMINVLANDTDPDGGTKTIASISQTPANGTVNITNAGADLTYTPNANYCNNPPGTTLDTFKYTVNGGSEATVTVTVTCVDDPPKANDDSATVNEDSGANSIPVLANDTDGDGGPMSVNSVTQPAHGTVNITGGGTGLTYAPAANYCNNPPGTTLDTFTYTLTPGDAVTPSNSTATVTVTVTCVNDAPSDIALTNSSVSENLPTGTAVGDFSTTDVDAGDTHTYALVAGAGSTDNASFQIVGNQLQTNAVFDFETKSVYSIRVQTKDASNATFEKQFNINITDANDAPAVNPSTFAINENSANGSAVGTATYNDPDAGQTHVCAITAGNTGGAFAINASTCAITVANSAALDFETNPTFALTVQVTDNGTPNLSGSNTVTVNLNNVNEAPVLSGSAFAPAFTEDGPPTLIDDNFTVTDPDGTTTLASATFVLDAATYQNGADVLSFVNTANITGTFNAATRTLTLSGTDTIANYDAALRSVTFSTSSQNPGTTRSVTVKVNDGGLDSNGVVKTIAVTPVNDPPVVTAGGTLNYTENAAASVIDNTVTVNDVDSPNITSANVQITGNYVNGQDVLSFVDTANIHGTFDAGTGTLTLTGTDTLAAYQTAMRSVKYNNPSDDPSTAARTVTWVASDGAASSSPVTSTIHVSEVNDAPTAGADTLSAVLEDSPKRVIPFSDLLANDSAVEAGQTLNITGVSSPVGGTVAINGTNVEFTLTADFNGTASFTYTVQDNGTTAGASDPKSTNGSVSYTVTPVNDVPSFTKGADQSKIEDDPAVTVSNWATAISKGPANESGQTVSFIVTNNNNSLFSSQPAVSATGTLTYTLAADQNGSAVVSVQIHDDGGTANGGVDTSAVQTFNITVTAVNDAPTIPDKNYSAQANMKLAGLTGLLTGASDAKDNGVNGCNSTTFTVDPASFSATTPTGGVISNVNTSLGTFDFEPPAGFTGGNVTFTYQIKDTGCPGPGVNSANVTVTVAVSGPVIWFVDGAAGNDATGNGTLFRPYKTLAAAAAVDSANPTSGPFTGQRIFLYSNGATAYAGGITLENNEWLVGQSATAASFDALFNITPPANTIARPSVNSATQPIITSTSNANGVNLASNNTLNSLQFKDTDATAVNGTTVGTLTLKDINISNTAAGSGNGYVLSGTGTVTNSGTNTIQTNFATALTVSGVAIGSGNLTFQSINAGSGGGAANGIVLNNTGTAAANGGLVVVGTGGTCTLGTPTCTGGTIQNTTGAGISLANTKNVSLTRIAIKNSGGDGIGGQTESGSPDTDGGGVNGFTFDNGIITDVNTAGSVNGTTFDMGIQLTNATGTVTVSNSVIDQAPHNGIHIVNTSTNMAAFNVTNTTVSNMPNSSTSNNGILVNLLGTSTVTATTVSGSTFTNIFATGIQFDTNGSSVQTNLTVTANHFTSNNIAMNFTQNGTGSATVSVINNTDINNQHSNAINFATAQTSTGGGFNAKIQGNVIGTQGTKDSGSAIGNAMFLNMNGDAHNVFRVDTNTIREVPNARAINAICRLGSGGCNLKFTSNTVSAPTGTNQNIGCGANVPCPLAPFYVEANSGNTACVVITGNTSYNPASFAAGSEFAYYLHEGNTAPTPHDINVENNGGDANATNAVANHNTGTPVTVDATVTLVAAGTCGTFLACLPSDLFNNNNGVETAAAAPAPEPAAQTPARVWSDMPAERSTPAARHESEGDAGLTNVAYVGPLGSAPTREVHNVRASYEAGDAVRTSEGAGKRRLAAAGLAAGEERAARQTFAQRKKVQAPVLTDAPSAPSTPAGNVNVNIGSFPAGKTVKIRFKVTVNSPFNGAQLQVSNQGSVSFNETGSPVQTDDPSVAGASDPTVTPIQTSNIQVNDAKVSEPASGSTPMLFTVTLSHPAGASGVSVNYATANGGANPATGGALCGGAVDYQTTSGTLNFAQNEQVKTISVNVCADASSPETDETFLLNLTSPVNGQITDGQATGTITQGNPSGTFIISELRTSGPAGAGDDFVELYNNTDAPLTITASDASAGYGLFKMGADCSTAPVLIATIPNATVIPARGHYLLGGSQYSLKDYGGTDAATPDQALTSDIESDRNVALFSTADVSLVSSATRLDAVGFGTNTGGVCELLREGTNLPPVSGSTTEHTFFRKDCDFVDGVGCSTPGNPKDTNDNSADFMFADTQATAIGGIPPKLGAPGPENKTSPIRRDTSGIGLLLLDGSKPSSAVPNRVRNGAMGDPDTSTFGTLVIRRRVVNNTGADVSRLRFRIVEMTTAATSPGVADLRAITGDDEASVGPVGDQTTCTASGAGAKPCNVSVSHTTLETPPAQPKGGGLNSTLSAGTITLANKLANGASLNVNFKLGVQSTGTFRFLVIIEALP
jgi:VCBS repeat-containing protein